jgi:hypothetical protein
VVTLIVAEIQTWEWKMEGGKLTRHCQQARKDLSSDMTNGKSDSPVTTRTVPATYKPKDHHSKEYRRFQTTDFKG